MDQAKVALTRSPILYDLARKPWAAARFAARIPHDRDYAAFGLFHRDGPFLDVGANAGMSALSFRVYRRRGHIVCIEPNPFHERDLRFASRLARDCEFRLWAAGAEDGTMTLHVPVFRGVPLTTEASLHRSSVLNSTSLRARLGGKMDSSEDFEVVERQVPVRRLDTLNLSPAYIKLDVQGSEYEALLGLRETVQRALPVVMVESADDRVRKLLADAGYESRVYDADRRSLGPDREAINTFFVAGTDRSVT
jgi:FkbM family methyltransferase